MANSSLDSGWAIVHVFGGERNLSQLRQKLTEADRNTSVLEDVLKTYSIQDFGIPSVTSTLEIVIQGWSDGRLRTTHVLRKQGIHKLAEFGSIGVPALF